MRECRKCQSKNLKIKIAKDSNIHFAKEVCLDCKTLNRFVSNKEYNQLSEVKAVCFGTQFDMPRKR